MNHRFFLVYGAAAASLLVGGCGGAAGAAPTGPVITVAGTDAMRFNPETIEVKAGQPVTISFKNAGVIAHDFVTEGADKNARLVNVGGGRTQNATFEASKPGTYQVVCIQPGHKEAGMVGKIVVS